MTELTLQVVLSLDEKPTREVMAYIESSIEHAASAFGSASVCTLLERLVLDKDSD